MAMIILPLGACGPFVDANPRDTGMAGSLAGIQDTGIGANHMGRIDTQN
ncbi:MAG TPA: hypothetical protein VD978_04235 [Azospirillum sp.]|nr:hypothetical protein [Azospirillum sp.]